MPNAKTTIARRGATFVLAAIACLLLIAVAPLLWPRSKGSKTEIGRVEAAPRDTTYIETPVILSTAPFLRLDRGRLTAATSPVQTAANGAQPSPRRTFALTDAVVTLETANPIAIAAPENPPLFGPDVLNPFAAQLALLGFDRLQVQRLTVRVSVPGRSDHVLSDLDAVVENDGRGSLTAVGAMTYRGERIAFDGATTVTATPGTANGAVQSIASRPLRLNLSSPILRKITFDGRLESHSDLKATGRLDAELPSALGVARWLGVPVADGSAVLGSQITAAATWSAGVLGLRNAELRLDGQPPAQGVLNIAFPKGILHLDGTLAFTTLRLDPYLAAATPATAAKTGQTADWRAVSLDWDTLRSLDLDLRLSASDLRYGTHNLGASATTLVASNGTIYADVSDISVAGTRFRVRAETDRTKPEPSMALRGRIDTGEVQALATQVIGDIGASGPASTQLDLSGTGRTLGQWTETASGKIALTGAPGIKTVFDPKLLRRSDPDALSADGGRFSIGPNHALVEAFTAKLSVTDRQTVVDEAVIKAGGEVLALRGSLPRKASTVDLRATLAPLSTTSGKATKGKASRAGPANETRMFDIRGAWNALHGTSVRTSPPVE